MTAQRPQTREAAPISDDARGGARSVAAAADLGQPQSPLVQSDLSGIVAAVNRDQPGVATMPSAIPAEAAATLPKARMIDPRGHRFGAGVSAILLTVGFLSGTEWLVAVALLSIAVSAAFGLRFSIYGVIWRRLAKALSLPKVEPEHEYPPRFAQVLGSITLTLALISFALGAVTIGWGLSLAVVGLQTLLATTGYCLGCRLYFLRWWVPDLVTRLWTRGKSAATTNLAPEPIRYR